MELAGLCPAPDIAAFFFALLYMPLIPDFVTVTVAEIRADVHSLDNTFSEFGVKLLSMIEPNEAFVISLPGTLLNTPAPQADHQQIPKLFPYQTPANRMNCQIDFVGIYLPPRL